MQLFPNQKQVLPVQQTAKRKTCVLNARKCIFEVKFAKTCQFQKVFHKHKLFKTLDELKRSLPVAQALGLTDSTYSLKAIKTEQEQEDVENKSTLKSLFSFFLTGSGKKGNT